MLYQLGRTEEALEDENRALSIDRNFGKAHLGRAVCLFKIGKIDEARAELKRAEDLKVSIPEAIRQTIAR